MKKRSFVLELNVLISLLCRQLQCHLQALSQLSLLLPLSSYASSYTSSCSYYRSYLYPRPTTVLCWPSRLTAATCTLPAIARCVCAILEHQSMYARV